MARGRKLGACWLTPVINAQIFVIARHTTEGYAYANHFYLVRPCVPKCSPNEGILNFATAFYKREPVNITLIIMMMMVVIIIALKIFG